MERLDAKFSMLRKELDKSAKPYFFFDDDPDGLCSFLLLYRYKGDGKGTCVKARPKVIEADARRADEFGADAIFVLDMPMVEQEFFDAAPAKVFWIDHHEPLERQNVTYVNPRLFKKDAYYPTSLMAYNIVKQDLWIAAVGVTADFLVPPFLEEFKEKYPGYVNNENTPEELLFETKLGKLINIFSMILKGPTSKMNACIKVLTRIEHPDEILNQTTPPGKFLYKYYEKYRKLYDQLLEDASGYRNEKDDLYVFTYQSERISLTADVALELLYKNPDKVVIVAREKDGEMKLSIRARKNIRDALQSAIQGLDAQGGGHEMACGASVNKNDWDVFLQKFRDHLS